MVKVIDQRLTKPNDSLRKLLARAEATNTRPFGVKVAGPSDATIYRDSTGETWRWDGDVAASYDSRLSEGEDAIQAANEALDVAEDNLSAARDRIKAVEDGTTPEAIGDTAADQINNRRLIVGRDAILTGTVDVAQLNVTEDMSAQVVNAMSANARRLVVTEDAILNRVTVVQSIVTPELVADRINVQNLGAKLVTSGALQTNAEDNKGVKIDSQGYRAYDSDGKLAVSLDGKNNLMVGSFQTSVSDKTGVKISSRGSTAAIDIYSADAGTTGQGTLNGAHAFAFFSSPTTLGSTAFQVGAVDRASGLTNADPQIVFRPINKSISFHGKFDSLGAAFQCGQAESATIAASGYKDITVTFDVPLTSGTMPIIHISPSNANSNEVAWTITKQSVTGFTFRLKNLVSNRETGYNWLRWTAFAAATP